MKRILVLMVLMLSIFSAQGQGTEDSRVKKGAHMLGVKLGYVAGVNYEYYMNRLSSVEVNLEYDFRSKGLTLMPLYKLHIGMGSNFSAHVGAGVNFSLYALGYKPTFVFGFDPTVGIDYLFNRSSIGVYYRPQVNLGYSSNWLNFGIKFGFAI